jgi:hypothetical protein
LLIPSDAHKRKGFRAAFASKLAKVGFHLLNSSS